MVRYDISNEGGTGIGMFWSPSFFGGVRGDTRDVLFGLGMGFVKVLSCLCLEVA